MKMSKVSELMDMAEMKTFRGMAEVTTMSLLELYVKGLNAKEDPESRQEAAVRINILLDTMPPELKNAVVIELLSAVVESVELMRKAGVEV